VLPGAVDTPMLRASMDRGQFGGPSVQPRLDNLAGKTVNGRVGTPREIAQTLKKEIEESHFLLQRPAWTLPREGVNNHLE